ISGDAGLGVFDEFKVKYPDRFLNLGVAEQNMASFTAGLSMTGFKVYMYNIIPFVLYRCYEQVRNDICYQALPVTLVGIGSGITYAPQGMTHYSIEDIGIARTLPNLEIISPIDPVEAKLAASYSLNCQSPVYVRLAKRGEPNIHKDEYFDITKPQIIKEGNKIAILFHGSIGTEVMDSLEGVKRSPLVISIPMISPLDYDLLLSMLKDIHTVITVEEHFIEGGLGTIISDWIVRECLPFKLKKLGIKNEFIHAIKDNRSMRSFYGISSENIKNVIECFEDE
ncbi:MAG TPA: transketolase family protein, partial [Candidatus Brocadiaceae bacterium]